MESKLEEYEIIDGKPYGGLWMGRSLTCLKECDYGYPTKDDCIDLLEYHFKRMFGELEMRHKKIIFCEAWAPLQTYDTVGLKVLVWGRAYKVQHLLAIGCRRYKKKRVAGRMKLRRCKPRKKVCS